VYGREEETDTLIEKMTRDQDPILRCGGIYPLALEYRGTSSNKAIHQLLHFAVSDMNVRQTAVLALGFVLYSEPEQAGPFFFCVLDVQSSVIAKMRYIGGEGKLICLPSNIVF